MTSLHRASCQKNNATRAQHMALERALCSRCPSCECLTWQLGASGGPCALQLYRSWKRLGGRTATPVFFLPKVRQHKKLQMVLRHEFKNETNKLPVHICQERCISLLKNVCSEIATRNVGFLFASVQTILALRHANQLNLFISGDICFALKLRVILAVESS